MYQLHLLFDQECRYLGEVASRDGNVSQFLLNQAGEASMGAHLQEWNVRGIPVVQDVAVTQDGEAGQAFFQERIQPRDSRYLAAVRRWLENRGFALVSLSDQALKCWNTLILLPLEDRERFTMTVALRDADGAKLSEWSKVLQEAVHAIQAGKGRTRQIMERLQKQASTGLAKTFSRKKRHD